MDGNSDVDGGYTRLLSPAIDLSSATEAVVTYAVWYSNNNGSDPNNDYFYVHVSSDNGSNWTLAQTLGPTTTDEWKVYSWKVTDYAPTLTSQMKFRFEASDLGR